VEIFVDAARYGLAVVPHADMHRKKRRELRSDRQ
jgi:hypothetical protein